MRAVFIESLECIEFMGKGRDAAFGNYCVTLKFLEVPLYIEKIGSACLYRRFIFFTYDGSNFKFMG